VRFSADDKVAHAHQWWKDGDHPEDTVDEQDGTPKGRFVKPFKGTKARPEAQIHDACGAAWAAHGKITGVRDPVCPGSWIVEHKDGSTEVYMPNIYGLSYEPQDTEWMARPVEFIADCRVHKTPQKFSTVQGAAQYAHTHQIDTNHVSDVYMVETAAKGSTRKKAEPKAKKAAAKEPAEAAATDEEDADE